MSELVYSVIPLTPKIRSGTLDPDERLNGLGQVGPETFAAAGATIGARTLSTAATLLGGAIGAGIGMKARSPGWALVFAALIGLAFGGFSPSFARGLAAGLGGAGIIRLRER